jgi:hypothetical protein
MRIAVIMLTLMVISSSASAKCYTNSQGRVECSNGEDAGGYNSKTGNGWKSQEGENGVRTTQTSKGGKGKSKNGKGAYHTANGKNCYKTANSHGCS